MSMSASDVCPASATNRDTSMEDIGMDIMANVHCLEVQYRYETGLQEL